jgi:hypothetical protein
VTDISAVAYDWLATGKPLVVTDPADPLASRPRSALLERLPLLSAGEAADVVGRLRGADPSDHRARSSDLAELAHHYFGDTAHGASTRRFETAVTALTERS